MPPAKLIRCENCNEHKPAKDFPPSPMSPAGSLAKCMACVRLAARAHRAQPDTGRSVITPTPVRPLQARLAPHLVQAAVRFVAEYQPGVERPIDAEMSRSFATCCCGCAICR